MKKIYYQKNSLNKIIDIINKHNINNIFLVTGNKSYSLSGAKKSVEKLLKNKQIYRFSEFSTNPKYEDVLKGIEKLRESQCEIIIAIGGGSVIDMAKLINVFSQSNNAQFTSAPIIKNKLLPFIAIPTTAGSGSEATHFAVVYNQHKKYSIVNEILIPTYTILDYSLLDNISNKQFAISALDALSHSIESYWAKTATKTSKKYASFAIKLILKAIKEKDKKTMLLAAHLAGKSINITKTTGAHAASYYLTSNHNIPHGLAVALLMPSFIKYNSNAISKKLLNMFNCNSVDDFICIFNKIIESFELSTKFSFHNINKNHLQLIIDNINNERMKNNPIPFNKTKLYNILLSGFK